MKNTTRVLAIMMNDERKYTRQELTEETGLTFDQVWNTLRFLKDCKLILVDRVKTNTKPYRMALYYLNPEKYEGIIKLLSREGMFGEDGY